MLQKLKDIYTQYKSVILYLFFGGCTTVINVVSYYVFNEVLGVKNVPSTVIAWFLSVVFAYVTNKIFVFESKRTGVKENLIELTSFFGCRLLTGILDVAIMAFTVDIMKWNSKLMKMTWKVISNVIVIIINYIASKLFIFKKSE